MKYTHILCPSPGTPKTQERFNLVEDPGTRERLIAEYIVNGIALLDYRQERCYTCRVLILLTPETQGLTWGSRKGDYRILQCAPCYIERREDPGVMVFLPSPPRRIT